MGIYEDSNQVSSLASCNLQTGAISIIRTLSFDYSRIAAYNHADEKYYYIGQTNDTTLYTLDPVSGQLDSVDLPFMNTSLQLVDLQYDNTHQLLYALYNDFGILGTRILFRTINPATGSSSLVYSPVLGNDILESVNLFAFDEANQKYIYTDRVAGNTLGVADMINGTNTRYNMSSIVPAGEILTHLEFDYYTNTLYALRKIANHAPVQPLCMVSVDSTSSHNVIVWEKTDKAATVTYNLYRETTTNVFTLLATIDRDSLSEYHDYAANPNITGYRYQMTVTDTSGNVSAPSTPHQTIHLQYLGSGNLSWVPYAGSVSPVTTYDIYCDSLANGNWLLMGSVPAAQTTYTDIQYLNHPAALYRLAANFPFSCTAARGIDQAWSNTASAQSVGLFNDVPEENVQLYPVPAINQFIISGSPAEWVSIYNANGQLLNRLQQPLNNRVDIHFLSSGLYFVAIYKAGKTYTQKLLVSH
ncbi:MAG: T9SS type A sorting domain-containing protein [Chitinophagales bacterium]